MHIVRSLDFCPGFTRSTDFITPRQAIVVVALLALGYVAAPFALKTKVIAILALAAGYVIYSIFIRCLMGKVSIPNASNLEEENRLGIKERLDGLCKKHLGSLWSEETEMGRLLNFVRGRADSKPIELEDCCANTQTVQQQISSIESDPPIMYGIDGQDRFFVIVNIKVSEQEKCPMLFRYKCNTRSEKYEMRFLSEIRLPKLINSRTAHSQVIELIQNPNQF